MKSQRATYSGRTNYQTLLITLWMDKEGQRLAKRASSICELAENIKSEHYNGMPDLGTSVFADLLGAPVPKYTGKWPHEGPHGHGELLLQEPEVKAWLARQNEKRARVQAEWDAMDAADFAHRRNPDYCAKCGGECEYDDQGNIRELGVRS